MKKLRAFCARKDVYTTGNIITLSLIATTVGWIALTGVAQLLAWQHNENE